MKFSSIYNWTYPELLPKQPIVISGPCSAENPKQLISSTQDLKKYGVHIIRAGIWKPRTRPGSFEGLGEIALPWLIEAGKIAGLPVCCEIANPNHLETALKYGVDMLWIGARTTANPFAVQELSEALKGVDVPIFIKNPVNPDLELWIGAIERVYNAGIKKIAAIHRGFSVFSPSRYRNAPQWEIPIELKRRLPSLNILNDPSHISGKRSLLYEIAQKSFDLDFDGLMIECHHDPEHAWTDAEQQLKPSALNELLLSLKKRDVISDNKEFRSKINDYRKLIDNLDAQVLDLIGERMKIVRNIGDEKKKANIAILQFERWKDIREICMQKAKALVLSEKFIEDFINTIHNESIDQQTEIMQIKKGAE